MAGLLTLDDLTRPRTISLKELRDKLLPLYATWPWADDAIVDLWKLGAPDPQALVCPQVAEGSGPPCRERECPHVKRILLPGQFQKWVHEVEQRQGNEFAEALHRQPTRGALGRLLRMRPQ